MVDQTILDGNGAREDRGREIVAHYVGLIPGDYPEIDYSALLTWNLEKQDSVETIVVDLLADVLHFAADYGMIPDELTDKALLHVTAEHQPRRCQLCGNEENAPIGDDLALGVSTYGRIVDGKCVPCRLGAPDATTCRHCGRAIVNEGGRWIDPQATGDDSVWRETCDAHDTFTAEHEPIEGAGRGE